MREVRWLVTRANSEVEDIGAERLSVDGGALVFYDAGGNVALAVAPGQWIELCEAGYE